MKKIIFTFFLFSLATFSNSNQDKYIIKDFNINKYLGTWFEIVRKENIFEKDLDFVTATYSLNSDGNINVLNKGFNITKNKESQITGKAKKKYENIENILEVSFFGPFYSDYIIADYDKENYNWALVLGKNSNYMWILSRKPQLDEEIRNSILNKAVSFGIELTDLVYVKQE